MRLVALCVIAAPAWAAAQQNPVPLVIAHHGRLLGEGDVPVNGTLAVKFAIYAHREADPYKPETLVPVWDETYDVEFAGGSYALQLGDVARGKALPAAVFEEAERFLGITVPATGTEMTPRLQFGTVPFAYRAARAASADALDCDGCVGIAQLDVEALQGQFAPQGSFVELKPAAGGAAQSGHLNVSGTVAGGAGSFGGDLAAAGKLSAASGELTGALGVGGALTAASADVTGALKVGTGADIGGGLAVGTAAGGGLTVGGGAAVTGDFTTGGNGGVTGDFTVGGDAVIGGGLLADTVAAATLAGDGAAVTNLDPAHIAGIIPASKLDLGGVITSLTCPDGQAVFKVSSNGTFECRPIFAGLPDTDSDGVPDVLDDDDDGDGVPDTVDPQPLNRYLPAPPVFDGSLTAGTDLGYQYSPLTGGQIKANWAARSWAASYRVSIGTTAGGSNTFAATPVGAATSYTASGLTLQGAWQGTTYYVTVAYLDSSGATLTTSTSNGVQIAEAASWDGAATTGLRNAGDGGFSTNFPNTATWNLFYGAHYFESVNVAASTTVNVQPWGKADSVQPGVSPTDAAVTSPKDGWLAIYANNITVAGTIDARGRGYGGGAGNGAANSGLGGAGGLSGAGGSASGVSGGAGLGGGGGGTDSCNAGINGGSGGLYGGGGGGGSYNCNSPVSGSAADSAGNGGAGGNGTSTGGAGGTGYAGGKSKLVTSACTGPHYGGGGGWGAGGGGGGCGGTGGGGGGTGGYPATVFSAATDPAKTKGAGPAAGSGAASIGRNGFAGGYDAAGSNGDTTTDASFRLGSGGGGGGTTSACPPGGCEGGGGGGAGGGAIKLVASGALVVSGQLFAGGGSGGGGCTRANTDADDGGGGGGGGGGIVVSGGTLTLSGTVRTLGGGDGYFPTCPGAATCGGSQGLGSTGQSGGNGGDGDSRTQNGGTIKVFYGTLVGSAPAANQAGRIYDAGSGSALR